MSSPVVFQQISPSALRAYKSSKYVNGQPQKLLLEARKAKRATSQFMSREGAREAGKKMRALKKATKKSTTLWDKLLKKIPGKNQETKAAKAGGGLASIAVLAGLTVALAAKMITDIQIQNIGFENEIRNESEFQKTFQRYQRNVLDIRALNKRVDAQNKTLERNNKDLDSISKDFFSVKTQAREGRKLANDALYETRQGRQILDTKIAEARKLGNDALYETRQGRAKLESQANQQLQNFNQQINNLKNQFQSTINSTNQGFQTALKNTVTNLQREITSLKNNQVTKADVTREVKANNDFLSNTIKPVKEAVNNLQGTVQNVVKTGVTTKVFEGVTRTLQDTYNKSFEAQARKFQEEQIKQSEDFLKQIKQGTATQKTIQEGIREVDKRVNDFYKEAEKTFLKDLSVRNDINQTKQEVTQNVNQQDRRIGALETKITEIEKMDKEANRKLDALIPKIDGIIPTIGGIPLIAGRVIDGIKPSIPTIPQIETATGRAMCTNFKTGCGKQALDNAVGNINSNNNQNSGALLDRLNAGLGAADLAQNTAMLNTINNKLGEQVPGGLSGKLDRFSKWLQLDRLLNMLTFAATVHNAAMLSNDIATTLGGALNSVLTFLGFKDDSGNSIDIGNIISGSITNFIKSIIGEENYTALNKAWQNANRIYQATTNAINSIMNANSVITNALEIVGGYTGKIGNALRTWGIVGEKAYQWMNPQPNFDNKWITTLEKFQQTASTVAVVAQIPIDVSNAITEVNTSTTELVKAIKQEPNTKDGIDPGEATKVKEEREASKAVSGAVNFDLSDLFDNED